MNLNDEYHVVSSGQTESSSSRITWSFIHWDAGPAGERGLVRERMTMTVCILSYLLGGLTLNVDRPISDHWMFRIRKH